MHAVWRSVLVVDVQSRIRVHVSICPWSITHLPPGGPRERERKGAYRYPWPLRVPVWLRGGGTNEQDEEGKAILEKHEQRQVLVRIVVRQRTKQNLLRDMREKEM